MQTKNIGGDRLGSGNKMNVQLHGFERSNHDLSYLWKSTMSPGTLIPFMNILALPGDTFDIDLDTLVKTHPTIGPLFGSFKIQLDVFTVPIRLYNKILHNNKLGVGNNIANVKFPLMTLKANNINLTSDVPIEFQQINQSSIFAYLGIRGLGDRTGGEGTTLTRNFNAIPYLGYWDIFKNYYANKQEEHAYVIHAMEPTLSSTKANGQALAYIIGGSIFNVTMEFEGENIYPDNLEVQFQNGAAFTWYKLKNIIKAGTTPIILDPGKHFTCEIIAVPPLNGTVIADARIDTSKSFEYIYPSLTPFDLANIDTMREDILASPGPGAFTIDENTIAPYGTPISPIADEYSMSALCSQEGLAVKTYQSDIFNNWVNTETQTNIAAITAISTAGANFTIDQLNLSKKIYDMLNRVAVSGGSYQDWLEAIWDHSSAWRAETPVYHGGLSKEIVFQEVVSQSATTDEPLGSLAGKGIMTDKHKGGKVIINVDEPCYIMGIVSITPRLCYSQGNDWTVNLKTLDDLHKPSLDGIGFQDLVCELMHFATCATFSGAQYQLSAGKQPAWINYMTNFDKSYGNFADPRSQQFMTLDRRYQIAKDQESAYISDLTTYIDPSKFNYAFAQTDLSAQNFWTQIACNITARRKMSSKIIPNL